MRAASGRAVFRALVEADVRFLVVGGLAVNVHGFMRMTLDIDVVVKLEPGNIARTFAALASVGYRPTVPVSDAEFGDVATREGWVREKNMRVLRFHSDEHWETPVDVSRRSLSRLMRSTTEQSSGSSPASASCASCP